jgi:hypothetical protein
VIDVNFFEPDHRDGVCVSLEEWAARIFQPISAGILHDANRDCKNTKLCIKRSKTLSGIFSFTRKDLSKNVKGIHDRKQKKAQNGAGVATSLESSPDCHQGEPRHNLLHNIGCGINLLLKKSEENSNTKKKKKKTGEQDDNTIAQVAASSLLALVNGLDKSYNFNKLDEMQIHMSKLITEQEEKEEPSDSEKIKQLKAKSADSEKFEQLKAKSGQDESSSSSSSEDDTFGTPSLKKRKKIAEFESDDN